MAIIPPGDWFPLPAPPPDPGQQSEVSKAYDRLGNPVQNLPNIPLGEKLLMNPDNLLRPRLVNTEGFGIDTNDNGRYDPGQDAIIGIDSNNNGHLDPEEITRTNAILNAQAGNADTNHDGKVSDKEKIENFNYREQFRKMDRDGDGKLTNFELDAAGAKAWVDKNGDGNMDAGETQSIDTIKAADKESRIGEIDPLGKTKIQDVARKALPSRPKGEKLDGNISSRTDKIVDTPKVQQPAVPKTPQRH